MNTRTPFSQRGVRFIRKRAFDKNEGNGQGADSKEKRETELKT